MMILLSAGSFFFPLSTCHRIHRFSDWLHLLSQLGSYTADLFNEMMDFFPNSNNNGRNFNWNCPWSIPFLYLWQCKKREENKSMGKNRNGAKKVQMMRQNAGALQINILWRSRNEMACSMYDDGIVVYLVIINRQCGCTKHLPVY